MALVIEDGTIVSGANSYATLAELVDFANLRGYTIPSDPADQEVLMTKAMDFLESLRYYGTKVSPSTQELAYPRECVYIDGELFPDNDVPKNLVKAQCALAVIANTIELLPNLAAGSKGIILSESVFGAVSRSYAASTSSQRAPHLPLVNSLLYQICEWMPGGLGRCVAVRA